MDDLISRKALLNDLCYCAPELWHDEEYIRAKIEKQPAVDAVPVVRCENCKHRWDLINCPIYSEGMETFDGWFCADGKRREEE